MPQTVAPPPDPDQQRREAEQAALTYNVTSGFGGTVNPNYITYLNLRGPEYYTPFEQAQIQAVRGGQVITQIPQPVQVGVTPGVQEPRKLTPDEAFRRYNETLAGVKWNVGGKQLTSAEMMQAGYKITTATGQEFTATKIVEQGGIPTPQSIRPIQQSTTTIQGEQFYLSTPGISMRQVETAGALGEPAPSLPRQIREAGVPERLTTGGVAKWSAGVMDQISRGTEIMTERFGAPGYWLGEVAKGGGSLVLIPAAVTGVEILARAGPKAPGLFAAQAVETGGGLKQSFQEKPVETTVQLAAGMILSYGIVKGVGAGWERLPVRPGYETGTFPGGDVYGTVGIRRGGAVEQFRPVGSVTVPGEGGILERVQSAQVGRGYPEVSLTRYLGERGAAEAPVTAYQSEVLARALVKEARVVADEATLIRSARDFRTVTSQSGLESGAMRDVIADVARTHEIPNPDLVAESIMESVKGTKSTVFGSVEMAAARENVPGQPVLARSVKDIDIMAGTSKEELSTILYREINKAANIDPFAKVEMELREKTGLLSRETTVIQEPTGEIIPIEQKRYFGKVEVLTETPPKMIDWHTHPADIKGKLEDLYYRKSLITAEEEKIWLRQPSPDDIKAYIETQAKEGRIVTPYETVILTRGKSPFKYEVTYGGELAGWQAEMREPVTTMETGHSQYVSLKEGEIVGPSGKRIFDIKEPQIPGEYGGPSGYVKYGMRQEGTIVNPEGVKVMEFSEQMSRKVSAAMDQIRLEPATMEGEEFTVTSRITPKHPGQMKSILDVYTGEQANIAKLEMTGRTAAAQEASVALEQWLEAWGGETPGTVRNLYQQWLNEAGMIRTELYAPEIEPSASPANIRVAGAGITAFSSESLSSLPYSSNAPLMFPSPSVSPVPKGDVSGMASFIESRGGVPSREVTSPFEGSPVSLEGVPYSPSGTPGVGYGGAYTPPPPYSPPTYAPPVSPPPISPPPYSPPGYPPYSPPSSPPPSSPPIIPPWIPSMPPSPPTKREDIFRRSLWRRFPRFRFREVLPIGLDISHFGEKFILRPGERHGKIKMKPRVFMGWEPGRVPKMVLEQEKRLPTDLLKFKKKIGGIVWELP